MTENRGPEELGDKVGVVFVVFFHVWRVILKKNKQLDQKLSFNTNGNKLDYLFLTLLGTENVKVNFLDSEKYNETCGQVSKIYEKPNTDGKSGSNLNEYVGIGGFVIIVGGHHLFGRFSFETVVCAAIHHDLEKNYCFLNWWPIV